MKLRQALSLGFRAQVAETRHMFICFPSLPQTHTKREGPCDLKIQFANIQSLLVINSPLKMCRACAFKHKCLTGLQAGESNLSTRLQAHRLAPSLPGSCPHELSCQGLVPPHQDKVHTLGVGGCAFPEEPGFIELHRTLPREG